MPILSMSKSVDELCTEPSEKECFFRAAMGSRISDPSINSSQRDHWQSIFFTVCCVTNLCLKLPKTLLAWWSKNPRYSHFFRDCTFFAYEGSYEHWQWNKKHWRRLSYVGSIVTCDCMVQRTCKCPMYLKSFDRKF